MESSDKKKRITGGAGGVGSNDASNPNNTGFADPQRTDAFINPFGKGPSATNTPTVTPAPTPSSKLGEGIINPPIISSPIYKGLFGNSESVAPTPTPAPIGINSSGPQPTSSIPFLSNDGIGIAQSLSPADLARQQESLKVLQRGGIKQLGDGPDNQPVQTVGNQFNLPTQSNPDFIRNNADVYARAGQLDAAIENALRAPRIHRGLVADLTRARSQIDGTLLDRESADRADRGQFYDNAKTVIGAQQTAADIAARNKSTDEDRQNRLAIALSNQESNAAIAEANRQAKVDIASANRESVASTAEAKAQTNSTLKGLDLLNAARKNYNEYSPSQAIGILKASNPKLKLGDSHLKAILPDDEYKRVSSLDAAPFYQYAADTFGKDTADELLKTKFGK